MKLLLTLLILIFIALQVRLWTGEGSFAEVDRLSREIAQQEEDNAELAERNEGIYEEVEELRSGHDAIEERARNDLGLVGEGETFYLIVEEDDKTPEQN